MFVCHECILTMTTVTSKLRYSDNSSIPDSSDMSSHLQKHPVILATSHTSGHGPSSQCPAAVYSPGRGAGRSSCPCGRSTVYKILPHGLLLARQYHDSTHRLTSRGLRWRRGRSVTCHHAECDPPASPTAHERLGQTVLLHSASSQGGSHDYVTVR